jgi:hypothetical protein
MWEYVLQGNQEYGRVVALQTYVLHIGCAYGPAVACGGSDPQVGMKDKRLLWNNLGIFQACELGLPLQGLKFDSGIIRFLQRLRLLDPFAT